MVRTFSAMVWSAQSPRSDSQATVMVALVVGGDYHEGVPGIPPALAFQAARRLLRIPRLVHSLLRIPRPAADPTPAALPAASRSPTSIAAAGHLGHRPALPAAPP